MEKQGFQQTQNGIPFSWHMDWRSGRFYSTPFGATYGGVGLGQATIYTCPIYVPNHPGITIDSLGLETTVAGGVGALARCALYECKENGVFGKLVIDSGSFATDGVVGWKGVTGLAKWLPQGWYFAAGCGHGSPTVRWATSVNPTALAGATTRVTTSDGGLFFRFALATADVTDIVNNGYPSTFSMLDSSVNTVNVLRVMIGV